jgi:hypothetical protein
MSPRGPNPTYRLPLSALRGTSVDFDGQMYGAELDGNHLKVSGGRANTSWAQIDKDDTLVLRVGDRVPELLARHVPRQDREGVLVAAAIVAALAGHPRREPVGQRITFIWTDHIALAAGLPLRAALDVSHVRDRQGAHIRSMEGRIQVHREI